MQGCSGAGQGGISLLRVTSPSATALIYGSACLTVAALSSLLGGGVLQVSPPSRAQPHPRKEGGITCIELKSTEGPSFFFVAELGSV